MLGKLITDQLVDEGVPLPDAVTAAAHVLERLREVHGGQRIYVPSARQHREGEIASDWRAGVAPKDIARRRNVDLSTVYRVIKRQRSTQRQYEPDDDTGFGSEDWNL